MSLNAISTKLEDWRYADPEWLESADPAYLGHWAVLDVPAGETRSAFNRRVSGAQAKGGRVQRLRVHVGKGGRYEHFELNCALAYSRIELEVTLEEGAHFEFGGVTLGAGEARQEFVTKVIHAAPGSSSNQVVRAVQWDRSIANFLGRVEVKLDAQKTDAAQNFRAMLLEAGASANAKPELEIFADDVKCAHGAAIGALDEQAAFYMASRGIPPAEAKALLVRAFIADAFVAIPDQRVAERMMEEAVDYLAGAQL